MRNEFTQSAIGNHQTVTQSPNRAIDNGKPLMFLTRRTLPRRAVLRGLGATVALPFLDAMVTPGVVRLRDGESGRRFGATDSPQRTRLVCIEMVHGAAGSSRFGLE
jgi:hypothetical protein